MILDHFKKKSHTFKESRPVGWNPFEKGSTASDATEILGSLKDLTFGVIKGGIKIIKWATDLPGKAHRYLNDGFYNTREWLDKMKDKRSRPSTLRALPEYSEIKYHNLPSVDDKKYNFDPKVATSKKAAGYHRNMSFLAYKT